MNVTNPRGIVVDPRRKSRYVFWSDWGRWPRIERAGLDGSNRTIIISTKIYWPNGLAIDLFRERLYFADAHLDYIESCSYDGQKRTQIIANDLFLHHPHSLSFFEEQIFWVDRGHTVLAKKNRMHTNKTVVAQLTQSALTVKVAHSTLQPQEDNPCLGANCEQLCLLSSASVNGYRCDCQVGYLRDSTNENRCNIDETEFLIVLNKNIIGGIRISSNDTQQPDESIIPRTTLTPAATNDGDETSISFSPNFSGESDFLWDRMIPVSSIKYGYDFAYDYKDQIIFFLQHNFTSWATDIEKVNFDGTNRNTFTKQSQYKNSPFCLEVDPSSRNIFIGNIIKSSIDVYNMRSRHRAVLLQGSNTETGVGYPLMFAINYIDSELYWIDEGDGQVPRKIGGINLDGSNPRNIIQNELNHLVSIYFHIRSRRIYWVDAGRNKIESSKTDGTDRIVVLSNVEHPSAIAIWDTVDPRSQESVSILYYSDVAFEQIIAYNLRTLEKRIIRNNVPDVVKLQIFQKPQLANFNPCLNNNGGCHHICLPSKQSGSGRICRCSNGLKLLSDGSCTLFKHFLIYSSSSAIGGIPFSDESTFPGTDSVEAMETVTGRSIGKMDFDYKSKTVFWIENGAFVKTLKFNQSWTSTYNGMDDEFFNVNVLFELDSYYGSMTGLAVDWVNNLLYYTYFQSSLSYIKVCKLPNGDFHSTIVSSKSDKFYAIAVNPKLRYIYWIDQAQNSKIERAFLNGENRTILAQTDIITPTDIFIDISTGDVYWTDNTKDRIEKMTWDGKNRVIIKSNNVPNPVGVGMLNNIVYYIDSRLRGVYAMNITGLNMTANNLSFVSRDSMLLRKLKAENLQDIAIYDESIQPYNLDSPCLQNTCDQLCFAIAFQSTAKCSCAIGELDSNDGRTCKTPKEYLIFAMEHEIRSINLLPAGIQASHSFSSPWRPITGLSQTIGIDFDFEKNKIFFSDIVEKKLSWFNVNEENPQINNLIINNATSFSTPRNISQPDGLSYDWVSDTIYWSDSRLKLVASLSVNTGMRYVIAYSDQPRAIVVHPCKGYLFWTDTGREPAILRSSLAGSDLKSLIKTDIKWPNGLTIDFDDDMLYWADAFYNQIERSNLDGNYRQVLATALHPFALTVHHHYIYWTDWYAGAVFRAEKYSGSNTIALVQGLSDRPMDIHVWSEQRQKCQYNPCSSYNGGCSHICLVAPGNKTECRCPTGLNLRFANNDRSCVPVTAPRCNATQFSCANGNCINKRFVCDSIDHCGDKSDESVNYCAFHRCLPSEFSCRNGRCIPMPERCDRNDNCGDNSDEVGCIYPSCAADEFQCRNFRCIPIANRCNGYIDCRDGNSTDEVGCPPIACNGTRDIKCPNTNICIPRRWLCDGDNDCGDSADENRLFCNSIPCSSNQFRCTDHRCIPYSWYCDGDRDCSAGEDEPTSVCRTGNWTCPDSMFRCNSGRCIDKNFVCDGDNDCGDNSDEDVNRHNCLDRSCRADEFRCESGVRLRNTTKCIRANLMCDGYPQCIRAEDELQNCTRRECRANEFKCANGFCINARYIW